MIKRFITYYLPLLLGAFLQATICFAENAEVTYTVWHGRRGTGEYANFTYQDASYVQVGVPTMEFEKTPPFVRTDLTQYTILSGQDGDATKVLFQYTPTKEFPLFYLYFAIEEYGGFSGHVYPYMSIHLYDGEDNVGCVFYNEFTEMGVQDGFIYDGVDSYVRYYRPWDVMVYDLSAYVGRTITIEMIATCCSNHHCWTHFYTAFEKARPADICGNCDNNVIVAPAYSNPIWRKGSSSGPIISDAEEMHITREMVDDYYCTLSTYCGPMTFLLGRALDVVPDFSYKTLCAEGKDTLFLSNKSYMKYRTSHAQVPCDTALWTFSDGQQSTQINVPYVIFSKAGKYTISLRTGSANFWCDSIITKEVPFGRQDYTDLVDSVCQEDLPYRWRGKEYRMSGDYTDTIPAQLTGCDSVLHLLLTVLDTTVSTTTYTICEGETITWNGKKYSAQGIYRDTLVNVAGCDSLLTLNIKYKSCSDEPTDHPLDPMPFLPIRDTLDTTICIGDTLMWHGIAYAHDTTARDTGYYSWYPLDSVYWVLELKTEVCCDTTYSTTDTIFLYDSLKLHPFMWFEKEYVEPGVYNDTLKGGNYMSCDSIGSLLLRVMYKDSLYACGDEQVTFHTPWGDYDSKPDCECLNGYLLQTLDGEWLVDATLCVNRIMADTTRELRTISQGDSLVFVDTVLYTSGIYSKSFLNKYGCDSTHIIELIVIPYPDNIDTLACRFLPDANSFDIKEKYSTWGVNSMTTPLVADMDGDGLPEIIACAWTNQSPYLSAGLLVINGQNGDLKYTIPTVPYRTSGQKMTIADVNRDSKCEIFIQGEDKYVYCYDEIGNIIWKSVNQLTNYCVPLLADINNDGNADLVIDGCVFSAIDGTLILKMDLLATGMGFAAPHSNSYNHPAYYMPALYDIDGDGTLELCAGNTIYKMQISNCVSELGNTWSVLRNANETSTITNYDGQTIIIDFDKDGDGDICVLGLPHNLSTTNPCYYDVYVWDGQTSEILAHKRFQAVAYGDNNVWYGISIPYAGDINGDYLPEIVFNAKDIGMIACAYDETKPENMSIIHNYAPYAETCGFTVFDFNQDGKNEIVYRGDSLLTIVDGSTLQNLCTPIRALSGTLTEYPVVADVNGDGHAEIVIARSATKYKGGKFPETTQGWVSVYESAIPNAWSSARPVWNQWAYNSVNINDDMTVPQYQYDIATQFPNGTKPFNSFLAQKPIIDKQGDIFVPAADANVTAASYEVKNDSIEISVSYCNTGDANLIAPYEITVYQNEYRGTILQVDTITESLNIDSCKEVTLKVPALSVCQVAKDTVFVIAINDDGHGIAQHGNQQAECDTTNNQARIVLKNAELLRDTTVEIISICDSDLPYTHSTTGIVFPIGTIGNVDTCKLMISKQGCDSVVRLQLTVISTSTEDTTAYVCYGDLPYLWHGKSLTESCDTSWTTTNSVGCDSVVKLHLFVGPEPKKDLADTTICYGDMIDWHGQPISAEGTFYDTARVTMGNGQLCDSIWYELAVTIQKSDTTTNNISICTGGQYTWKRNGKPDSVIRKAGEYWDTVRYVLTDCDSMIYHLTLQIEDINRDSVSAETCANTPYLWRGQNLTAEGIYRDTAKAKTVTECDTVYTLRLTINQPTIGDTIVMACDSFTWHGVTYTESTDTATWTTTNIAGCDSIVTLHLTINHASSSETTISICPEELPYTWNGKDYTGEGDYTYRTINAAGCDSTATLHLKVIQCCPDTIMRRTKLSICDTLMPYTWVTWREVVVEETGSFADTLRNDVGCDSIIYTLTLDTFHCCAPLMAAIDVPDYICADAPYLPIEVKLLSGECASYSLHFTNPALNKMPFRDTTITIDVQYASDEPFILDIPVPDDPDDSTHYVRPDDNYKVSLTLHDRCENSIIFGDSIFSVYYPSWVTDQHWDDVIALLNDRYNGGYTFSSVQWLRDGEELAGEDGLYIYLPHELWTNPSHQYQSYFYQALLTRTDDGKTLPTCPLEPWHIDNTNVLSDPYVSVTPTLVPKENPVVHVMTNTEGTYWIYDPAGKLLQTADYEPCEHSAFDIRLYCVQTMYILVFTPRNEKKPLQHKYSVVKVLVE